LPATLSVPVFLNERAGPLTRFGVRLILKKHVAKAAQRHASLKHKRLHPHSVRHYADLRTMPTGTKARSLDEPSDRALGGLEPALHAA
jgi:site-specific recombinase XerD